VNPVRNKNDYSADSQANRISNGMKKIYLDYAAATPLDTEVKKAMEPYFSDGFYNPSATYLSARRVRQAVSAARADVAQILGAKPAEIVFTAGATEANNLAIQGVAGQFSGQEILISNIEHESVIAPAKHYGARMLKVTKEGLIDHSYLEKALSDKTVLVSVIFVSNELGSVQPLKEVAGLVARMRRQRLEAGNKLPLYLHTDATQAANFFSLSVERLGVDLMSLNGSKIYGPKGSGCLYIKAGVKLQPLLLGGGQETGWRSGTENVPAIIGFAAVLAKAQADRRQESARLKGLRQQFETGLVHLGGIINGGKNRAPHLTSVTFPGIDNERLMIQLDEADIECAVGSACSAADEEPSHVLKAIGLTDEMARGTLRFSLGRFTAEKDIQTTLKALAALLAAQQ
jgi:cysteine desulfurase